MKGFIVKVFDKVNEVIVFNYKELYGVVLCNVDGERLSNYFMLIYIIVFIFILLVIYFIIKKVKK